MGDENPIRTLRDYSKPSHEGYRNTIEFPVRNNVDDPRDFAKPVKEIALPQDVPSTSDRRLIELENQVQRLMEAHFALTQPTQVNKVTTSCEICSGPHDTQYCMKDPKQAFVEYASSCTDETRGKNRPAFVQGEVSTKMEDPRLFTLLCRLGDSKPFDTLADLGSCVNIIPLYLFKKLNIEILEETGHIFGLADGTKTYPVGIVKDVEVRIGKLKLLNDFYVIDMKKDPKTPLLVGRGFQAIANTVIDCRMAKIAVGERITSDLAFILRTNTKTLQDLKSQRLERALAFIHDTVTLHLVKESQHLLTTSARTDSTRI
uniref:MAK10-like protein n=1 Tax=Tanacetum cinerariifolium TaxID=118510 RepID=A0A6L2JHN8_TANCI|nr:MAK10-like protein [Tanacetum cinerariifolium]